jgi:hypothetical protein
MSVTAPCEPTGLSERFALVLDGLCRALAAHMAANRAAAPLLILLWSRLRRAASRFAALAARAAADPAPSPRPRTARPRTRPSPPYPRLPQGFAWLIRLVPEAAAYGGQLQHLLSQPDMAALLQAAPQAARILRPLCRMLAVPSDTILPPPAQRPVPRGNMAGNVAGNTTAPITPVEPVAPAPSRPKPPRPPFRPPRAFAAA